MVPQKKVPTQKPKKYNAHAPFKNTKVQTKKLNITVEKILKVLMSFKTKGQ